MADELAGLMADLLDAWNSHDIERVASFYAPDYVGVDIGQARPQYGPAERCRVLASYVRAFPDLHFTGETIIEDNRIALVWTMRGTHRGSLMRIPPTGRTIEVRGVSLLTVEDGKVKRGLNIWDMAGLLRGLGLLPEL
ncbi:MAG: ester cyclase [Chloroflexota bacterium]|nr:ester cyclase [Chloroflexota bacterium]